jgi:arabinose-5-phosphate isomerase
MNTIKYYKREYHVNSVIERGQEVIRLEAETLVNISSLIDNSFSTAVEYIGTCKGKVIVSGIGKAGIVARKIAASFSSLGTSSFFMHPADASHGDLGMVTRDDIMLLLSNSGDSLETNALIPSIKAIGCCLVAICGNNNSSLGKAADIMLNIGRIKEACSLGLAPTCSTTAMLALGDALAICVMEQNKNFNENNYAFYHPGGALGKKMLKVEQVMRTGKEVVLVPESSTVRNVIVNITRARAGCALCIDTNGKLSGVFSDGDLRRHLETSIDLLDKSVKLNMTVSPKTIQSGAFARQALAIMREFKIGDLPVLDTEEKPIGVVSLKDLLEIGLV